MITRPFVPVALALALLSPAAAGSARDARPAAASARAGAALERLADRYATLLARHRPDLAERYGAQAPGETFVPLDQVSCDTHVRELETLLTGADSLEEGERADSLRARLRRELDETRPGGALRRDPLLWLDIVDAAARAPFATGPAGGCDRTRRATRQLRAVPEALRAAVVLMAGAAAPDPARLEARLGQLEALLRHDLPARTEACKEARRRAEFVEADSLAAASLADFRRWTTPGR